MNLPSINLQYLEVDAIVMMDVKNYSAAGEIHQIFVPK